MGKARADRKRMSQTSQQSTSMASVVHSDGHVPPWLSENTMGKMESCSKYLHKLLQKRAQPSGVTALDL
jgi:hypothetical protein